MRTRGGEDVEEEVDAIEAPEGGDADLDASGRRKRLRMRRKKRTRSMRRTEEEGGDADLDVSGRRILQHSSLLRPRRQLHPSDTLA
jgi:hypothetical protein